ncbi:nicotinamide riboside transporter PnuC, partial [bacterium]|nr:nicotinamide riboside transporter PnuC [bacterium]
MKNMKQSFKILSLIYLILIVCAVIFKDSPAAVISAVFGITYTFLAGKGNPVCYLFGVTGSGFYSYLAFHNALWGNLVLYLGYYVPMQILGFFRWKKH